LNIVAHEVDAKARRIMATQLAATAVVAVAFGLVGGGGWSALSALCGGLTSLSIVLLLRRSVRRASEVALIDQKKSMMILYLGAAQRFIVIIAFFALGLGMFGLAPLAMFAGFAAAQASNIIGAHT
jgi:ATP synthase protein I